MSGALLPPAVYTLALVVHTQARMVRRWYPMSAQRPRELILDVNVLSSSSPALGENYSGILSMLSSS